MAKSNRKAESKTTRASRRGFLRRGARRTDEEASQAKRKADLNSSKAKGAGADPQLDDGGEVSSLLETTGAEVEQLLEAADDAAEMIREAARTEAPGTSGDRPVEGNETSAMIGKINKDVRDVLESADEAAEKIREEARAEARRLIEESRRRAESVTTEQMDRVSEMTEQVLGELSAVQGQLEALRTAFDQSIRAMGADLGVEQGDVWDTQQNGAAVTDEESADLRRRLGRRPRRKGAHEPEGISEGARLLAMQQHMAGVDAEKIEERLKEQFGIEDPKPVLEWMGLQPAQPEKPQRTKKR